jgi:hypothetical protein
VRVVQPDLAEIRVFVRDVEHRRQSVPHRRRCVWRDSDDDGPSAVHVRKPLGVVLILLS